MTASLVDRGPAPLRPLYVADSRPINRPGISSDIKMTTQRVSVATGEVQLPTTCMSTKATAFTIDELLRPERQVSADRRNVTVGTVEHQQNSAYETACCDTTECRVLHKGRHRVKHLCGVAWWRNGRTSDLRSSVVSYTYFVLAVWC